LECYFGEVEPKWAIETIISLNNLFLFLQGHPSEERGRWTNIGTVAIKIYI
jgi:hypothetical protein